jgi:peptide/nickel transport system permease protein
MTSYFLKKMAGLIILLLGITFVSFFVIHLAPGSPAGAWADLNPKMSAQAREKLNKLYGLDQPLIRQYGDWLARVVRLDFGNSFVDGQRAIVKIGRAVPVTLLINLLGLFLILLIGIPLGILGAVRKGSFLDNGLSFFLLAGFCVPGFWLALVLVSWFGAGLHLLPVSGLTSIFHEEMSLGARVVDLARHLVLPISVILITGLAGVSRFMRSSMLDVLRQNYIRSARARGLSETKVLWGHALPNAVLPLVTLLGLSVPGLLGGSVVLESIFSIPGMGRLFYQSVFARDYPVIMGILVLGAVLTLLGNLLADVAYGFCDPRIHFGQKRGQER